jgi:O-antigen ligase
MFAAAFGAFLGLSLLKFGNPPIMEKYVTPPEDIWSFLVASPWPIHWAYVMLACVAALGLLSGLSRPVAPPWLCALPLAWLAWQGLAALRTVDPALTGPVLRHFVANLVCFYLGLLALSRGPCLRWFWPGLAAGFLLVLALGWEQHFGGLKESRNYFFTYVYPSLKEVAPEFLKKINSDRIFSTLFYPNSLAGAILLLLPAMLAWVWLAGAVKFTPAARGFLAGAVAVLALGCLYWSGSKAGWLLALLSGFLALLKSPAPKRLKWSLIVLVLVSGIGAFALRYAGFFQKGAPSVAARFDYWRASLQTALEKPLFGTGPGTFARAYAPIKRPESEMARLVHNDYLEQASDSGIPGFLLYLGFVAAAVTWSAQSWMASGARTLAHTSSDLVPAFPIWLGLLAWTFHALVEFPLYLPALAWPAFALLGLLVGRNRVDNPPQKP